MNGVGCKSDVALIGDNFTNPSEITNAWVVVTVKSS
jgi:hypothetical protein